MINLHKDSELRSILGQHLPYHGARISCLSYLIMAFIKVQSVNFQRLATGFDTGAKVESNHRRIQRFFKELTCCPHLYALLLRKMLPVEGKYGLSLDRTNWKFGTHNINILFLCVIYQGVGIPILWKILGDKRGNSSQAERIDLLHTFIRYFGVETIDYLTADREFIGQEWIQFLIDKRIRFYIRVRGNMKLQLPDKKEVKVSWLLQSQPLNQVYFYPKLVRLNQVCVYFSGMKYVGKKGQIAYLALVTFQQDELSLDLYKKRWQIETMFRAFKSAGFHLEDTHLKDYQRINTLLMVLCLAFIWAYNTGIFREQHEKPIAIKKHGRRAKSIFVYGLEKLAFVLINQIQNQISQLANLFLSCT